MEPDKALLTWLDQLSDDLDRALIRNYLFMTSPTSDKFAMSDEEAANWFKQLISEHDFPLRRVARILSVRAIFSFIFFQPHLEAQWLLEVGNLRYLHSARFNQARYEWQKLTQTALSDQSLSDWLAQLQD